MHELLADKAVGREWFRVSLADLRQAANKAKGASMKAHRALERWKRTPIEIGTLETHPTYDVEQNQ